MQNILPKSIKSEQAQTTLATLAQCTETKQAFNLLVRLEQNMTVSSSIENTPLIATQGAKLEVVKQIIRVIEFFLEVTGKELEIYQIQILAGDLYEKFKTDTLDDVVLMFKMARQGDFGKVYRCDTFEIMDWSNRYLEYKSATREKLLSKKKRIQETEEKGKFFHELPAELQEKFNNIFKKEESKGFLPNKATDFMTREKMFDDIKKRNKKRECE